MEETTAGHAGGVVVLVACRHRHIQGIDRVRVLLGALDQARGEGPTGDARGQTRGVVVSLAARDWRANAPPLIARKTSLEPQF